MSARDKHPAAGGPDRGFGVLVGWVAALALSFGVGLTAPRAQTVPALADQPLFAVSSVQPNLMLTLDNSGSMAWQFAPGTILSNQAKPCFNNHNYNRLFYNPNLTYLPPIKADGTRYADSSYTSAWRDGFNTGAGTVNLSTGFPALGNYAGQTQSNSNTEPRQSNTPANRGAYYYNYTGSSPAVPVVGTCYADNRYTLVDMNSATTAQKTNFANWFSYYRTRINAMKSSAGEAFLVVDNTFRVGLHTINNPGGSGSSGAFLPLTTFEGTPRTTWYDRFYQIQPSGSTPLREALQRIGEYYRAGTSPGGGSTTDPVQFSCQQNFHLLTTDGEWNGSGATGTLGTTNYNRTLPSGNPDLLAALKTEFGGTTFTAGGNWPAPYRENANTASTNTLADIAAYYWMTDLRPTMANNVPTSTSNPAAWQHMVTFGVAFSAQGTVSYPLGVDAIEAGTAQWPVPAADSPTAVDDLWHASLIGHGNFFSVSSPDELADAMGQAISEIQSRLSSGTGSVLTGQDFAVGTPVAFRAIYRSGEWTGDLQARSVDPNTGLISQTPIWQAQDRLEAQVLPSGTGGGWSTNRKIVTRTASDATGTAVRFREPGASGTGGSISATQAATLAGSASDQAKVVAYLRGDRSNEDTVGVKRSYRRRLEVLGDIVNSEPRYVGAPSESYSDAFHPGYSTFKSANATRSPNIYIGSNTGMLHAFKATVGDADSGNERWAYIPSFMFTADANGLVGLTWRDTGKMPTKFQHRFRVDQTPTVRDVDFNRVGSTSGSGNWRTLLVSGLNKGGKGYFALDVTTPDASSEDTLRSKVLWEFNGSSSGDSTRVGFSYGMPMIIYTNVGWMVAVSSGYQNATGTGHIWLLDPRNGSVIRRLDVPDNASATVSNPIGLAQMEVYFQSDREQRVTQLYATDLRGNVWRWDLTGATAASWPVNATKIASFGAPITTAPAISLNPRSPTDRWVYVGTGQLLSTSDISAASTRTFYAFKDGGPTTPGTFTTPLVRTDLLPVTAGGSVTDGAGVKGWYMDMTSGGGGQIVSPPQAARGVIMWATTVPVTDPCAPGATAVFYAREMGTATNRIANGSLFVTLGSPVTKLQVAQGASNATNTSSQRRQLTIASTSGADVVVDVNLRVVLTGGRSNPRFVSTQ